MSSHRSSAGRAIANAKLAYERFENIFMRERFKTLEAQGANVQRPLWASTSTKNPRYADLMYVETLVGAHTVSTIPPSTLAALFDRGSIVAGTAKTDLAGAQTVFEDLKKVGISLDDITEELTVAGVKNFVESYSKMLKAITTKQKQLTNIGA